jgi:hypothetical protein
LAGLVGKVTESVVPTPNNKLAMIGSGSFLSQNDLRLYFGLGKVTLIERAEVLWPSGRKEVFAGLKVNRVVVLIEGKGAAMGSKPSSGKCT